MKERTLGGETRGNEEEGTIVGWSFVSFLWGAVWKIRKGKKRKGEETMSYNREEG